MMQFRRTVVFATLVLAASVPSAAFAQEETTTYTYDALGRLVEVERVESQTGDETQTSYTYDDAGNRTRMERTGDGSGGGSGGNSGSTTVYVVVPLNGYSIIVAERQD